MNSYGRFLESGEFEITEPRTPRAWSNTLISSSARSNVSQTGSGDLTVLIGDQAVEVIAKNNRYGGRLFFIKDFHSGKIWCPTWLPKKNTLEHFSVKHGFGYSEIRSLAEQIEFSASFRLAEGSNAERWQISLKNLSAERRKLQLFVVAEILNEQNCLVKKVGEALHFIKRSDNEQTYFLSADKEIKSFDSNAESFFGIYPSSNLPEAITKTNLAKNSGNTSQPLGALEFAINLSDKASSTVTLFCGAVKSKPELNASKQISEIVKKDTEHFRILEKTKIQNKNVDYVLNSPDKDLNLLFNGFYYQQLQSAHFALSTEQNISAVINNLNACNFLTSQQAKKLVENLLAQQSYDGLWQESFSVSLKATLAILKYVNYLGFETINESYKYNNDHESQLIEHLNKAAKALTDNSAQLSLSEKSALVLILKELIAVLEQTNHHSFARKYWEDVGQLNAQIVKSFSKNNSNYFADQIWPIISKSISEELATKMIKKVASANVSSAPPSLLSPYTEYESNVSASSDLPGENQNGSASFELCCDLINACSKIKNGDYAWRLVKQMLPIYLCVNADKYKLEPFKQAAGIIAKPSPNEGEDMVDANNLNAKVYATVFEYIFGLSIVNGSIKIDPCIPKEWKNIEFSYKFFGASYHFRIQNPFRVSGGIDRVIVDGIKLTGNVIRPMRSGVHFVEVILG